MLAIGLLWYDNSKKPLAQKVAEAATRYRERFGREPNICYVNPADLPASEQHSGDIVIQTAPRVLRHHLWVSRETEVS